MPIVMHNIPRKILVEQVRRAVRLRYEFITVSAMPKNRYNLVAARKMWDRTVKALLKKTK